MMAALGLLLVALGWVLYRDWQFWFPQTDSDGSASATQVESEGPSSPENTSTNGPSTASTHLEGGRITRSAPEPPAPLQPMGAIVLDRAMLPPLQVEVVAGNERHIVQPVSPAVNVDLQPSGQNRPGTVSPGAVIEASERVRLSADTAHVVSRPVEPSYPMLAKQMKVQGAVVLEAQIGKDGNIQDLHVITGPTILSSAAVDAVRQWRFKPYLHAGQAVETQARITVNFTISAY